MGDTNGNAERRTNKQQQRHVWLVKTTAAIVVYLGVYTEYYKLVLCLVFIMSSVGFVRWFVV